MQFKELQEYVAQYTDPEKFDHEYLVKLIEEIGELAGAVRNEQTSASHGFMGSIEEEIHDCVYYLCAIANAHDMDIEKIVATKKDLLDQHFGRA